VIVMRLREGEQVSTLTGVVEQENGSGEEAAFEEGEEAPAPAVATDGNAPAA
jgi:hypothetical protein